MNMSDYDEWKKDPRTVEFLLLLDEHVNELAVDACEYHGTDVPAGFHAKQAGYVLGARDAMRFDPFIESRERLYETESDRPENSG